MIIKLLFTEKFIFKNLNIKEGMQDLISFVSDRGMKLLYSGMWYPTILLLLNRKQTLVTQNELLVTCMSI